MNDQFDELAKGLAQSVTRRGALKKLGAGLAGALLASLGLASKVQAGGQATGYCEVDLNTRTLTGGCVFKARKVKVPCPKGSGNCWTEVCDEHISHECPVGLSVATVNNDLEHCYRPYSQIACR